MTAYTGLKYSDTATATLAGLKQDIYYLGKVNASFIADGDLNRIINKYYFQLQEVVRSVNENFYMGEATTDLVVGDGSYTFPDGTGTAPAYEKIKSIWAAFEPADITAPLASEYQRVNIVDPDSISDPSYSFTEPTALMYGNYFVLLPLVTDITKYPVKDGLKMYYITEQNKLTLDVDVPKLFPSFHDAITQGALIDIAERKGDDKLKADSVALFKKRLEEIKAYASSRLPDEVGLVEGQDSMGGWEFPWCKNSMS